MSTLLLLVPPSAVVSDVRTLPHFTLFTIFMISPLSQILLMTCFCRHALWPGWIPFFQGAPTASASGSTYSKCILDAGDVPSLAVGQRASQTWTSELSIKSSTRTPGSTQSEAPSLAKVLSRVEVAQPLSKPYNNDKTVTPMLQSVIEVEDRGATFQAGDAGDDLTNEERAVLDAVPMPDDWKVRVYSLPRVLLADFSFGK